MSIILDLIVLAIIVLCVIISAKRGFVKVFVEVAGFAVATVLAFTISSPLADMTYDKIIEPPVIKAATEAVGESAEHEAWNALPDFLNNNDSALFGTSVNTFTQKIAENLSVGTESAVKTASQEVVKPVATRILSLLFSAILIFVFSFVVNFLAKFLNKVFSFSIVGKINSILGGVVGLVKGTLFAMLFCMIISIILYLTGKPFLIFSQENIDNSYLFKLLTDIIPF